MELELQKEHIDCYRPCAPLFLSLEETAETIVPDHRSDVARIVDVSACLLMNGYTVMDGRLTITGSAKLTLLYVAEDAPGLRSLEYDVPFEHSAALPDGCGDVCVEGAACGVEAKLLNPRKFFTRFTVNWRVTPYCRRSLAICGEIPEQGKYAIQSLCERHDVSLIRSISKTQFAFSDVLTLPGGRDAVSELLCHRVKLRVTEAKSLGGRVVLKGVACLLVLYASDTGNLCSYSEELPFSQILDGMEGGDGTEVFAALNLTDCEIHIGDNDRTIEFRFLLDACTIQRSTQTVCCVSDLYSTSYDLDARFESVELTGQLHTSHETKSVREQLETGVEVKCVLYTDVCFGNSGIRMENGQPQLYAEAAVCALYLDEAGTPLSLQRRLEVTTPVSNECDARVDIENVCAGDIAANIGVNGIELRFLAEFTITSMETVACACLDSLSAEPAERDVNAPSLVLRALTEGETLWDIAKQYKTTVEEILAANELTESSLLESGRMLLIPQGR